MASSAPYDNAIDAAALRNGLSPDYFRGLLKRESGFNPGIVNPSSGAAGLGQVLASTAARPGYGLAPLADRTDAQANIDFSAAYLAARIRAAGGDLNAGTTGYSGSEYGSGGIVPIGRADGQQPVPGMATHATPIAGLGREASNGQYPDPGSSMNPLLGQSYTDPVTGQVLRPDGSSSPPAAVTPDHPAPTYGAAGAQTPGAVGAANAFLHDWARRGAIGLLGLAMLVIALVAFTREKK